MTTRRRRPSWPASGLRCARAATLLLSEPMAGGSRPNRAGDAYFGLYLLAMGAGRARSPAPRSPPC